MSSPLRFGIMGTGNIARQFAADVAGAERCTVTAVGSRAGDTADAFADRFGIEARHGSYEDLLADEGVEAIYLSLPNSMHRQWTIRALEAGKHVLCEKPLAVDSSEAEQMFDAARRHDRRLVEAFMYRSHPLTRAVLEEVRRGTIGRLRLIRTSFCYRTRKIEGNIRFSTALAGGALMDIGCYCLSLARVVAGAEPDLAQCTAHRHDTGVDEMVSGTLRFVGGIHASFVCGMCVQTDNAALICGDEGYLVVPVPWKPPARGAVYHIHTMQPPRQDGAAAATPGRRTVTIDSPRPLYAMEADDFAATVQDGEAPAVSREDTIANMRLLDRLREQF